MTNDIKLPYAIIKSISQLDNIMECRLFGWILAKAQCVIKGYSDNLNKINIEHALRITRVTLPARYLLPEGDNNYTQIKKCFSLADKKVMWHYENTEVPLHIISFPELVKIDGQLCLTFVLHQHMWHALLDFAKGWRRVSLDTYLRFESIYSTTMYLLISEQMGNESITFAINRSKELFNCQDKKSYAKNTNFIRKVINSAQKELNEKSEITFEYTLTTSGRGGGIREIKIIPKVNFTEMTAREGVSEEVEWLRVNLDQSVTNYLRYNLHLTAREAETMEQRIKLIGTPDRQIEKLERYRHAILKHSPIKPMAYLSKCLSNEAASV